MSPPATIVVSMSSGTVSTPVGLLTVVSDGAAITRVAWRTSPVPATGPAHDALLDEALRQLGAYFDGRLTTFDLPFDLGLQSETTHAVLTTLAETVEHGQSITYGELAARSGTSIPARGVGAVMGANPIPIIVPCHRVLGNGGKEGGFSGGQGLPTKRKLLALEGVVLL